MNWIIAGVFSYLLGSLPTAYLAGKILKKIDIREHGSGNVGATNVFRVLGKYPGIAVLCIDILKGVLAVTVVANIFGLTEVVERVTLGLIAVAGHNWTVFLNFKGGKGVATSLGIFVGLSICLPSFRIVIILTVLAWGICFLLTGYVSLSSILAAIVLPLTMVATNQGLSLICFGVVASIFIVVRHRANIKRLLSGQESRVVLPFHKK